MRSLVSYRSLNHGLTIPKVLVVIHGDVVNDNKIENKRQEIKCEPKGYGPFQNSCTIQDIIQLNSL